MQAQTRTPPGKHGGQRQDWPTSGVGQQSPAFSPSPPVTSKAQWYLGDQVQAKFMGEWYPGKIQGSYTKGHLVLFDGFESQGAIKTAFNCIKPSQPVDAASNTTDRTSSSQPAHSTASTPFRSEGYFSTAGPAQQQDGDRDDNENEGNGGGGWGSDTTPNAFRQPSSVPFCATRAIHDDKVRQLQIELGELRRTKAELLGNNAKLSEENEQLKAKLEATELQAAKDRDECTRFEQHSHETLQKLDQVEKDRDDALQQLQHTRNEKQRLEAAATRRVEQYGKNYVDS
jgi:regulator of replication initiation timing